MRNYFIFGPVHEMSIIEKVYTRRTKTDHNSSPRAFGSSELKHDLLITAKEALKIFSETTIRNQYSLAQMVRR